MGETLSELLDRLYREHGSTMSPLELQVATLRAYAACREAGIPVSHPGTREAVANFRKEEAEAQAKGGG